MKLACRTIGILGAVLTAGACGGGGSDATLGWASTYLVEPNGISLNGISLNGISLNGISLNGISLNGVSLNGVSLDGTSIAGFLGESRVGAFDLTGAELTGILDRGATLRLRIDDVAPNPEVAHPDVLLYHVSYQNPHDGAWYPLCGQQVDGRLIAVTAVSGRWDYRQGVRAGGDWIDDPAAFTFACMEAAIAKCLLLGYKPWQSVNRCTASGCARLSLAKHHQACTRMLRADYCGDGTPHTVDGVVINVYDGIGLQADTERWEMEAEWDSEGARCISLPRSGNRGDAGRLRCQRPRQPPGLCGDRRHFETGTLLVSEHDADSRSGNGSDRGH